MKKVFSLLTLVPLSFIVFIQEFWLQPEKFIYKWNEPINIRFLTGEKFEGMNWDGNRSDVNTLKIYFDGASDDLTELLSDEEGDSLQLKLLDEGTAMVTFNSINSTLEMEPAEYNTYLAKVGMNDILKYRQQNNETDSAGKENYQQSVKTIFQVGKRYSNTFRQETSLPVDIILLENPYTIRKGDSLEIKILFQKEPLTNHFISLWHKKGNQTLGTTFNTDEKGTIKFPVETTGTWMISTVKMVRSENIGKADPVTTGWQSYLGSCTWGYE